MRRLNENDLAYFVGIICGDGYISVENSFIEVKDEFLGFLKDIYIPLIQRIFNITPKIIPESGNTHAYRAYFYSSHVVNLLKNWNITSPKTFVVCMPLWIKKSSIKVKTNFARGIMDTDGTISTKRNKRIINYPTIKLESRSKKLVEDMTEIFKNLKLNAKNGFYIKRRKPMFIVRLYGFQQLIKYAERVSFLHPQKLKKLNILLDEGPIDQR